MASSKTRQRALARAKIERQIARRAANARRRRQIQASIGAALAVVLVVVGAVWAAGGFDSKKKTTAAAADCAWTPQQPSDTLKDVGMPPTTGVPKTGTAAMTITTNQGVVEAQLDRAGAPCTVASFNHLAGKQFFNNTKCHRLTTAGIYVLQCGDPSGTGTGGPAYKFPNERVPAPNPSASAAPGGVPTDLYPAGTLAMANSGAPGSNGSQFFIVYKDGSALKGDYTIFGKVTKGLDVVQKVAAGGVAPGGSSETDGAPKTTVTIQTLTVAATPAAAPATPAPSASAATS